jgi:hypothetical protein
MLGLAAAGGFPSHSQSSSSPAGSALLCLEPGLRPGDPIDRFLGGFVLMMRIGWNMNGIFTYIYIYMCMYIYMYIYISMINRI